MKTMKLSLDDLAVDSFATHAPAQPAGTGQDYGGWTTDSLTTTEQRPCAV